MSIRYLQEKWNIHLTKWGKNSCDQFWEDTGRKARPCWAGERCSGQHLPGCFVHYRELLDLVWLEWWESQMVQIQTQPAAKESAVSNTPVCCPWSCRYAEILQNSLTEQYGQACLTTLQSLIYENALKLVWERDRMEEATEFINKKVIYHISLML